MNRLLLPRICVLLIFVVLVGRLYQLQLVDTEANKYRYATQVNTTRFLPVRPIRGEVYAADGKTVLAASVPIYNASVRPADLPSATSAPAERARVFAQLGQLLGISTTLTISPALVLEQDQVLRNDLIQGLGRDVVTQARLQSDVPPLHITIPPAQSASAAALAKRYEPMVRFTYDESLMPTPTPEPQDSDATPVPSPTVAPPAITGTLSIAPASLIEQNIQLYNDLSRLLGQQAVQSLEIPLEVTWAELEIPPERGMVAFKISQVYTDSVRLNNPIAEQIARADVPGYQTVIIKQDIPRALALVLRENASSLPGVVVEQDYRRQYPLSNEIKSLSHILGYIGRVNECDLARGNPARSWMMSLLESVGHAAQCGFVQKQINPTSLGIARYLNDDRIGKDGLEASYEEVLRGQLGMEAILVNAMNQPIRAPETVRPARDGSNLILTIDSEFQREVEQILQNWIDVGEQRRLQQTGTFAYKRDYKPIRSGVAIVMEVRTGRILAMVSLPAYDNNIWDPARSAEWQEFFYPSDPEQQQELVRLAPLVNHAIAGQYPPGSTLKPIDAMIALTEGVITPDTLVRDPGVLVLADQFVEDRFYYFPNSTPRDNGFITVSEALMRSSNVFFMSVAGGNSEQVVNLKPEEQTIKGGLGITRFAEGLALFGFNQPTGIDLAGELKGRVPTPKWKQETLLQAWTIGDTYNASIGQGHLEVTPLQLVTASAAIANDGSLFKPQIVKAITDNNGTVLQEIEPELIRKLDMDPAHFAAVRQGMRRSVTEGVNVAARDDCSGLSIAGKTGTAEFGPVIQLPGPNGTTREVRQSHSWFVGFAPYENPEIEVLALIEGTGDLGDGSATIAVPAVTQIMQAYFDVVPPNPLPRGCQADMPPLPSLNSTTTPTSTLTLTPTAVLP